MIQESSLGTVTEIGAELGEIRGPTLTDPAPMTIFIAFHLGDKVLSWLDLGCKPASTEGGHKMT